MMKLADVFGIGPEYAAQLEECGIRTILDLARVEDLEELSSRSGVPLQLLRGWQVTAKEEVPAWRVRRAVVAGSVGSLGVLAAVLVLWSGARAPTPVEKAYNQALSALAGGDTTEAVRVLDQSLLAGKGTAYLHNLRGVLYRQAGDPDDAARQFHSALEADSSCVEAWSNLGSLALDQGNPGQSIEYYEKAVSLEPEKDSRLSVIYLNLSVAHSKAGDLASARRAVDQALDLDPSLAAAHVQRGYLQQTSGELDDAETSYNQAVQTDPHNVLATYNLFVLRQQRGDRDGALEAVQRLQEIAPTSRYTQLATAHSATRGDAEGRIDAASGRTAPREVSEPTPREVPPSSAAVTDSVAMAAEATEPSESTSLRAIVTPTMASADSLRAATLTVPAESIAATEEPVYVPRDVEPRLKSRRAAQRIIEREYPESLRTRRLQGTVIVWVQIDVAGKVRKTQIQQSSGYAALDSAAVAAARQFAFTPAIYQDNPVTVWVQVPITFQVN